MKKNTPAKRNPLLLGEQPLAFDDMDEEEVLELTEEQEADLFMSRWMEVMHPFTAYKKYFANSDKQQDRVLREVKLWFTKMVTEGTWSEQKYVMVVDHILLSNFPIAEGSLNFGGKLYDEERLASQRALKKATGKRRRI